MSDIMNDVQVNEGGPGETQSAPDFETEARSQGWRPKEEFQGEPTKWVDAQTFVERGQNWIPHLKAEIAELRNLARTQEEFNRQQRAKLAQDAKLKQTQLQDRIAQLEAHRGAAISQADGNAAVQIEREIRATERELATTEREVGNTQTQAQNPAAHPEIQKIASRWRTKNPWYRLDAPATEMADRVGNEYAIIHPEASLPEVLDYVELTVKQAYPHITGQGNRVPSGPQGSNTRSGVRNVQQDTNNGSSGTRWDELDPQTQKMADEFIKRKVYKNRTEYLKAYDVDEHTSIHEEFVNVKK